MGDVSWFLGQRYDWYTDPNGKVSVHISQQAMIKHMLEKNKYQHCKGSRTPYCSGLKIDRIERDDIVLEEKAEFVQRYQSIIGGSIG